MRASSMTLVCAILGEIALWGLAVPVRCPVVRLTNGRVRPRGRGRTVRYSCYEGFTLVGNKYSTCEGGRWDTPIPVCVNAECPTPPAPENGLMAPKYDGAVLIYFCKPGYILIGPAEIYCDGRQWNSTAPHCRDTTATAPTSCDFEKTDLCWWEQDPLHDFDWKRHNFETPSSHIGTGPTHDHTLGPGNDGYYLYVEASGRLVNDTARIMSPLYNSSLTENGCFSFWYHMFGRAVGELNVYFKLERQNGSQLMFTKRGNQGNQWLHGVFQLPKAERPFQIIIEGVRGSSYVSDIAIDDVAILQGVDCLANRTENVTVTQTDEDQVEQVNAMQSCKGRCKNSLAFNDSTVAPTVTVEICLCTIDCADHFLCCPDYGEYCVLGPTDEPYTTSITPTNREVVRTTPSTTTTMTTMTMTTRRTTQPTSKVTNTTTTRWGIYGVPINPKDDIDPVTIRPTTRASATTTTNSPKPTTTRSPRTTAKMATEPFVGVKSTDTTTHPRLADNSDRAVARVQETDKPHRTSRFGLPGIIGLVIGVLTGLTITTTVALLILRRRKTYKRGSNGSALSEDSDVRFLTSDEILDFNLARPVDNDES